MAELYFTLQVDCECSQPTVQNPALGERAVRGLAEVLAETKMKATFFVVPEDLEFHGRMYRELEAAGHEIGLHTHAENSGGSEFLGDKSAEDQRRILGNAITRFSAVMGRKPISYCPGYFSANDFTFGILEELGFRHGAVSCPTRNLVQCASVWGGSSLDPRYPNRNNRVLNGDVDFVDVPVTVDPESRMWGGNHPQDLRIELVDAKNHWYTMDKAVNRQLAAQVPIPSLHALTHNTYDYADPKDFRRQTLLGVIAGMKQIAERSGLSVQPGTLGDIAAAFRAAVPRASAVSRIAAVDTRGRVFAR